MASAVLVSRNEPIWGGSNVYMTKYPNTVAIAAAVSNDTALFKAEAHRNPNPYKQNHVRHPSTNLHVKDTPSLPLSTDSTLLRRNPMALRENLEASRVGRVTYKLGAYTRRELKDLKKRLLLELEQVRILRTRIDNANLGTRFNYPAPPPPALQAVHATDLQQPCRSRTPKGKKKGRGSKRVNPFGDPRKNPKRLAAEVASGVMKRCRQILGKLMKYKHGWVFNAPVDVVGLGLHDYKEIIKTPMDLGTVKSNLDRNVYKSPLEFAADVRLTFNNALKYNPKGHDVHSMAETLLAKFEGMFNPVVRKIEENNENVGHVPAMEAAKLWKPKVREVMKRRAMSKEEKKTLGTSLMDLPEEKMVEIFEILKKRNSSLARDGDEIMLDIETLDDDTLWELDEFVSKYKIIDIVGEGAIEKVDEEEEEEVVEVSKKVEVGEEDVDIGEEIPVEFYPPVEIERDVNVDAHTDTDSSSSSSGTDSSSSSGSDSRSSSDDDDSVQSKDDGHGT